MRLVNIKDLAGWVELVTWVFDPNLTLVNIQPAKNHSGKVGWFVRRDGSMLNPNYKYQVNHSKIKKEEEADLEKKYKGEETNQLHVVYFGRWNEYQ